MFKKLKKIFKSKSFISVSFSFLFLIVGVILFSTSFNNDGLIKEAQSWWHREYVNVSARVYRNSAKTSQMGLNCLYTSPGNSSKKAEVGSLTLTLEETARYGLADDRTVSSGGTKKVSEGAFSGNAYINAVVCALARSTEYKYNLSVSANSGFSTSGGTSGSSSVVVHNGSWKYNRETDINITVNFWPNSYTDTYNFNYNGQEEKRATDYYNSYNVPSTPSRLGYTFLGWYTSSSGGNKIDSSGVIKEKANGETFYAHWSQNVYPIDVNILSPAGEQDFLSGTMTYYNSYSGNTYKGQTDQPENGLNYGGIIKMSDITPPEEMEVAEVYSKHNRGTITKSGNTYTYTLNYGGASSSDWIDEIIIQMRYRNYSLEFYLEGGRDGPSDTEVAYNSLVPASVKIPIRNGYNFEGFYTTVNGGGVKYYDSEGNRVYDEPWSKKTGVRLYAYWTLITYTITLDTNGGIGATQLNYNIETEDSLPTPSRIGYEFDKWVVVVESGGWMLESLYPADETLIGKYGSPKLKAMWTAIEWKLIFDAGADATVSPEYKNIYIDNEYGELPTPEKFGSLFLGWFTSEEGGDAVTSSTKMTTEGATIYAHWADTWAADKGSFSGGTGEKDDPFKISTAEDLGFLSYAVQSNAEILKGERKYFEQTAPINLTGKIWMPIGGCNTDTAFDGVYDGKGFAIIGLQTYNQTDANGNQLFSGVGLFGRTDGATLINVYLTNANVIGNNNVGGLVGENYDKNLTVYGCFVRGNVSGSSNVGGLVGYDNVITMQISNCGFAGDVNGGSIIAGGAEYGIIKNCYAEVDSDVSFCGDNAEVIACVYSAGGSKKYYDDTATGQNYFEDWKTYNGKPLPKGLTWIGGVASGTFSLDGYTKVG